MTGRWRDEDTDSCWGRGGWGGQIPEIGVNRAGRVMGDQRARSNKGQSLTNAERRPGYAENRAGLREFIELYPCAWLPGAREDRRLQTGGLGKAGAGGRGWMEERGDQVAKKPVDNPRRSCGGGLPEGSRGIADDGAWLLGVVCPSVRGGAAALGTLAREPPRARPAAAPQPLGGAGAASAPPPPGPGRGDPPSLGAPSPSRPLPAPPAPGALTWKRFFTHSFFMAGEGAAPAAGRGGDGRGRGGVGGGAGGEQGSGREPAPVAEGAAGPREPGRGEDGGGGGGGGV